MDSVDVQYWKRLDFSDPSIVEMDAVSATFWGFKKNTGDLRAFTFASPDITKSGSTSSYSSSSSVEASYNDNKGQLRVVLFEAFLSQGTFDNSSGPHDVPLCPGGVDESTKFWQQASVRCLFVITFILFLF